MWRIDCEYDIGTDDVVFDSPEVAYEYAAQALKDSGIDDSVDELEDDGLFVLTKLKVIT